MVKNEPCNNGPSVNVIKCSGVATGGNEEKVFAKPLIRKAFDKKPRYQPTERKRDFH